MTVTTTLSASNGSSYGLTKGVSAFSGGIWNAAKGVWALDGDGTSWRQVYSIAATLAVSAGNVSGHVDAFASSATVTSGTPGTTPSGGTSPYTYAWAYVSGDAGIACSSASAQNPTWSQSIAVGQQQTATHSAVWRVTLTDSLSATATATITITLSFTNETG